MSTSRDTNPLRHELLLLATNCLCDDISDAELARLDELHYTTGAIVILEGPAEFTVGATDDSSDTRPLPLATRHSHNSGYLALGKLGAQQIAELRERIDTDLAPPAQVAMSGLSVYYRADNVDGRGNPGNRSTTRLVNLASPGTRDGTIVDGSGIVENSAPVGTPFEYGIVLTASNETHIQASSYQIAGGTNRVATATWEFWLRADSAQMDGRGALYGEFPASAGTRHYLRLEGIGTATRAALYDEWLPSGNSTTSDSQLFNTSALTQLVVTKRGDTLTFYRNGARVGATKSHSETYSGGGITRTLFGKRADQNESFDGQFHIIRVYDRALTAAEVNANYRAEIGAKADRHNERGTANLRS